jgi:hypothetical protein
MRVFSRRSSGRPPRLPPPWDDTDSICRRALSGRPLRPWPRLSARRIVLLATDADSDAGVAAVWLVRRPGGARQAVETWLYERGPRGWRGLGGGATIGGRAIGPAYNILDSRPSAARHGPGSILTRWDGPAGYEHDGIVGCDHLRAAAEVAYIQAGDRRIIVPDHGYVVVAWKSAPAGVPSGRPPIAALSQDGSALTQLGPGDYLDSRTLASLDDGSTT